MIPKLTPRYPWDALYPPRRAAVTRTSYATAQHTVPRCLEDHPVGHRVLYLTRETAVVNLELTKDLPTAARTSVTQPGADQIPAISMIPKHIPTIPMGRIIPSAKGSGKENTLTMTRDNGGCGGRLEDLGQLCKLERTPREVYIRSTLCDVGKYITRTLNSVSAEEEAQA